MSKPEYNSYGERLYFDTEGTKCNIRGMIRREPELVASRYTLMEKKIAELEAENAELRETSDDDDSAFSGMVKTKNKLEQRIAELKGKLELCNDRLGYMRQMFDAACMIAADNHTEKYVTADMIARDAEIIVGTSSKEPNGMMEFLKGGDK